MKNLSCMVLLLAFAACKSKQNIPLPVTESEFSQPVARTLKYPEAKPISWTTPSPDSIHPPVTRKVDFKNVPSRPVNIGNTIPFSQPLAEQRFDFNNLPDTVFNLSQLKEEPLDVKKFILPDPVANPVALPKVKSDDISGLLSFGQNDGFQLASINDIFQDTEGNVWFVNDGILCRYSGTQVLQYKLNGNPTIVSMMRDKNGLLWLGTDAFRGIYVLDLKAKLQWVISLPVVVFKITQDSGGLYWVGTRPMDAQIINWEKKTRRTLVLDATDERKVVLDIKIDSHDRIWLSTIGGVKIINKERNRIAYLSERQGLKISRPFRIIEDRAGRFWISPNRTQLGVHIVYPEKGIIQFIGPENGLVKNIPTILEDSSHNIYLPADSVLYVLTPGLDGFKSIATNIKVISNIWFGNSMIDRSGTLWLGSVDHGLQLFDTYGLAPYHFDKTNGLSGRNIWGLAEDHKNQIWIGTNIEFPDKSGKINLIDSTGTRIFDYTNKLDTPFSFCFKILEDNKNRIWMALGGKGLTMLDSGRNTITSYSASQGVSPFISTLFMDAKEQLWIGTFTGVSVLSPTGGGIKNLAGLNIAEDDRLNMILEDKKKQIWIGTIKNGIFRIDSSGSNMIHFSTADGLNDNEVGSLDIDKKGRVWAATAKGINVFDEPENKFYSITPREGLIDRAAYTVKRVGDKMYVGTGKGLTIFTEDLVTDGDHSNNLVLTSRSFDRSQGLINLDFNSGVAEVLHDGRMAFAADFKMMSIVSPPKADTTNNPVQITGFSVNELPVQFHDNKYLMPFVGEKDTVWDAETGQSITAGKLPKDSGYLEKNAIKWDGLEGEYNLPGKLTLPSDQNYFRFQFVSSGTKEIDRIRYRYMMEGVDNVWSKIAASTITEPYRDLSSGDYTFKVAARNSSGKWSAPATFSFTIRPPWWKTTWAFLFYAICFYVLIRGFVRYRSRQLKNENIALEEKIKLRTIELQSSLNDLKNTQTQLIQSEKMASLGELTAGIAHEIQNPLNFVNNFSEMNIELLEELKEEVLKGNTENSIALANNVMDNEKKVNQHGNRADSIVKGMLQHSRRSNGQKEPTDLNNLADEYLRLSYHGLRAKDKSFNSTIETHFDKSVGKVNVVPQDIGRVLLNLFNNAFYAVSEKYSNGNGTAHSANGGPTVSVTTQKIGNHVEIKVKDNGLGIPGKVKEKIFQPFFTTKPAGKGTGLGLSMSYDIIQAHGGEIKVDTKEGEMTEFCIRLPV